MFFKVSSFQCNFIKHKNIFVAGYCDMNEIDVCRKPGIQRTYVLSIRHYGIELNNNFLLSLVRLMRIGSNTGEIATANPYQSSKNIF